ncbi:MULTISPECIES: hypothetical protein [unclassified Flavobacterium]|uniref:hypothetical protein n=1 Tax=unclassified Flavobacterium TaxID=196869 RepID=UPI00131B8400|nr:hypothetical protein [Flavobacterium sp. I-STPP5a]
MELKILDEILKYLLITEHDTFAFIKNDANKKSDFLKDIDNSTFYSALLKLVKDGYVNQNSKNTTDPIFNSPRTDNYYYISFEGMFFIKNGGYHQATLEAQRKENEYDALKSEQQKQAVSLLRLNLWLVFGAVVVAIDSILNILHFFGVYFDTSNFLFCIKPT